MSDKSTRPRLDGGEDTQIYSGGILIVSGVEILCKRDLGLGPIVAHEFRISVNEDGRPVVDAKCPVCGDISRVEFFS